MINESSEQRLSFLAEKKLRLEQKLAKMNNGKNRIMGLDKIKLTFLDNKMLIL